LKTTDIVVYERKGDLTPDTDARLDLRLPLVSRQVNVGLSDLLERRYLKSD